MTLIQIEKRVKALEQTVQDLTRRKSAVNRKWYRTHAGKFANDPVFDEIAKLGHAYRHAQRQPPDSTRS